MKKILSALQQVTWPLLLSLVACSSQSAVQNEPQTPIPPQITNGTPVKKSGEFYDLFDVPPAHPLRNQVGLLLWSGVPLEDDDGNLKPEAELTAGDFAVWLLAASNQPIKALEDGLQKSALLQLQGAGVFSKELTSTSTLLDREAQSALIQVSSGSLPDKGYPWFTKASNEKLTRIEGCRLLVEALKPEAIAQGFNPDRGDATLLLRTGKYWDSYWDAKLRLASPMQPGPKGPTVGKHKGITVESLKPPEPGRYGTEAFRKSVQYVKGLGANSIAVIPYARLLRADIPSIIYDTGAGYPRAATIKALQNAKEEGMRAVLKPHLWLANRPENKNYWTGIVKFDDEGWREYLARYRHMVLELATMASAGGADILVIGTEIKSTTKNFPEYMKKLIAEVRVIYGGELTYAANHDEFQRITFWGDLDYIGIDAYFQLAETENPGIAEIVASWQWAKEEVLATVKANPGKRVLFLEAGYKPKNFALKAPWEWRAEGAENQDIQANGYEALFQVYWSEEWFAGVYWWKYFSDLDSKSSEPTGEQFNPHQKKAEEVLKKYFNQ
jgi:hypothetical protein